MINKQPNKVQSFFIKTFGVDRYMQMWEMNKKLDSAKFLDKDGYHVLENLVWYGADSEQIEKFYKHILPYSTYQFNSKFWRVVNTNMPRAHYPLPRMISDAMGTLLFNQTPEFTVDAGSKARNKELQNRLDGILDTNDILILLQTAASIQSYSGRVGLKINYDPTITNDPLITVYPKEQIKVHRRYGQTIYIDFIDNYENDYKLVSRYGLGYINYMLFHKDNRVDLSALPETADLQDIAFFDTEDNIIPVMFATVVDNKGKEAQSDYQGLIDTFHALDEAYSSLNNYIRKTKPNTFITEDIAPKDATGKALPFNEFDNVITILDQAIGDNGTQIDRQVIDIKTEGYINTINKYRLIALEKIGLSPATLGIDGAGANQSGDALNIRERASGRLRGEKLANWKEQLNNFFYSLLVFDLVISESIEAAPGIYYMELPRDFNIKSNFGEYIEETLEEKSDKYMKMYEKGIISLDFAITQTFKDELSEDDLKLLIAQTKQQKGLQLTEQEQELLV